METSFWYALAVSGGGFLALWPVSVALRDAGVADIWWAPGVWAALFTLWLAADAPDHARALVILTLVGAWALRLGATMLRRWLRHDGEDRRYRMVRRAWGASFWWKSLFIVFALQAALQGLIALGPMSALLAVPEPLGWAAWAGAAVALLGLGVETAADLQLDRFKARAPRDALCDTGLRAYVRHPNYTGEIMFWAGVWLIGAGAAPWWSALSPILLVFLITRVSGAPMIRDLMKRNRPDYAAYAARTPAFIPRLGTRARKSA